MLKNRDGKQVLSCIDFDAPLLDPLGAFCTISGEPCSRIGVRFEQQESGFFSEGHPAHATSGGGARNTACSAWVRPARTARHDLRDEYRAKGQQHRRMLARGGQQCALPLSEKIGEERMRRLDHARIAISGDNAYESEVRRLVDRILATKTGQAIDSKIRANHGWIVISQGDSHDANAGTWQVLPGKAKTVFFPNTSSCYCCWAQRVGAMTPSGYGR
jgi:hypothetical protein